MSGQIGQAHTLLNKAAAASRDSYSVSPPRMP
jgi:hypothetical protein